MPVTDPYAGTFEEFREEYWREFVALSRPSGENIFNKRSGEAALVGYVPAACLQAAMRFFLGYEQVTSSAPFVLKRKNPIRHPYYDRLWCTGVAETEFDPNPTSRATLKKPSIAAPSGTPAALKFRSGYRMAKILARFGPSMVDLREDETDKTYPNLSSDRKEWLRNTAIDAEPRTETFETKLEYVFAEGEGAPAPYSNPKGQKALAEQAQLLIKSDVVVTWRDVPEAWLMKTGTKKPSNLLFCLGTLNKFDFLGYEAGTLLFVGAKLQRFPWTLKPRPGLTASGLESDYLYDAELLFSHFDPVKGFAGNPPVAIKVNRGHNNFPWRGSAAGGDFNQGLWFYASLDGTLDRRGLYQYTDYKYIFDCPQNPA